MFKIKRAVCEITGWDGGDVVINKTEKTVLYKDGHDLRLLATVHSEANIQWELAVEENIKTRATALLAVL